MEDVGGSTGTVNSHARQPNSFLYRLLPYTPWDLKLDKLQALQVQSLHHAGAIEFHAGQADADILSDDVQDLHPYGKTFTTQWVTIHDTAVDGNAPFNANALAKAKHATPFKRPENGMFRPGTFFSEFVFAETGDTKALTEAGSAWLFDLDIDYSKPENQPVRILAQGRDASATIDSALLAGGSGFQNDGDNEITGIHVSDGDPTPLGLLGAKIPGPFERGWRALYTQQHGDDTTWQILPSPDPSSSRRRDDRLK